MLSPNDETRTSPVYDSNGEQVGTRPYTDEENAALDARLLIEAQEPNRLIIEAALVDSLASLNAIIATDNAVLRDNPAVAIKELARIQRRIIRLLTRRLDGTT